MGSSDGCEVITALIIIFCGSVAAIVCGSVVLHDVEVTKGYTKSVCDASEGHLETDSSIGHYYGELSKVWVLKEDVNGTMIRDYQVILYFPPIKHYLLEERSEEDVKDWSSGLTSANTFSCRVDATEKEGVSTKLDTAGWIALMFFGCLFLALFVAGFIYICTDECSCCKTRSNSRSTWGTEMGHV